MKGYGQKTMFIEKTKRQRESKSKAGTEVETQRHREKQKLLGNIFVDECHSLSVL